jgi:hypothetical protein
MNNNLWNVLSGLSFAVLFAITMVAADWGSGKGVLKGIASASIFGEGTSMSPAVKTNGGGDAW